MTILQKQILLYFLLWKFRKNQNLSYDFWPITICADSQMNQSDLKEIHDSTKRGKVASDGLAQYQEYQA